MFHLSVLGLDSYWIHCNKCGLQVNVFPLNYVTLDSGRISAKLNFRRIVSGQNREDFVCSFSLRPQTKISVNY
jgi:hypothetical protein